MAESSDTAGGAYTQRLLDLQRTGLKRFVEPVNPYKWNIRRLCRGRVLDVGCGVGRNLRYLAGFDAVGTDHNPHSVAAARADGLVAYTPEDFAGLPSDRRGMFDTVLFSHVLEHLTLDDAVGLVVGHLPLLNDTGKVVVICPQERGYASDATHITYLDKPGLERVARGAGLSVVRYRSFPFPRALGKLWIYNEHIVELERQ